MILYDLICTRDHVFEAWFRDSSTFEQQAKAGEVACPLCGDTSVVRAPMAPNISTGKHPPDRKKEQTSQAVKALTNMRAVIEENCEYVGDRFAEEVRTMHHGEAEQRSVYGEATPADASELRDEGIEFGEMPPIIRRDS